jgi:hypothetical protein
MKKANGFPSAEDYADTKHGFQIFRNDGRLVKRATTARAS